MKSKKIFIFFLFFCCFSASLICIHPKASAGLGLTSTIQELVKASDSPSTSELGVYICNAETGEIIYQRNQNTLLAPASNLKLYTAAAALHYLGPEYTYKTSVYGSPIDPVKGIMEGSLYLVGSGDPTFCEPYMPPTSVLETFANTLSKMGLRRVLGDIIGDDSVFDRNFKGRGWKKDYAMDDYAAECAGLSLNANLIQITAYNGVYTFFPDCSIMNVYNAGYGSGEISFKRDPESNNVKLSGPVNPASACGATITVHNPSLFTTSSFEKTLKNSGIYYTGQTKLIEESPLKNDYSAYIELCSHKSKPLLEILKYMNKESDNLLAQHIFKTIGAEINGKGTYEYAESAIKSYLNECGIDTSGFIMADGCGLSRENKTSARQLGQLLTSIYKSDIKDSFISTLSQAGVDGTLKYRLTGLKVFAKTGTINECSSLAGFAWTANNKPVVFVIISNNQKLAPGVYKGFEDLIVDTVAKTVL